MWKYIYICIPITLVYVYIYTSRNGWSMDGISVSRVSVLHGELILDGSDSYSEEQLKHIESI